MNRPLRLPALLSVSAFGLVSALVGVSSLTGCAVEASTLTQFRGNTRDLGSVAYTPNANTRLRVVVTGGNVRLGRDAQASITVVPDAPAGQITAKCVPQVALKDDEQADAEKQMAENVTCSIGVDAANNEVIVQVVRNGARDSSLTAQLLIGIPTDFSGPVTTTTQSGDVFLQGVRGPVDAEIKGIGNLGVYPGGPILATDPGRLYVEHGDATLTVPAGSALNISAVSDDLSAVNNETGFAAVEGSTTIAQTIVVNGGGQTWNVRTDFGSILLRGQ